jgi:hypothetical protein
VQPTEYRIYVRGRLTEQLGSAFAEDRLKIEADATQTALVGVIEDQSHLFGVLDRVRDLGLELVSVHPLRLRNRIRRPLP